MLNKILAAIFILSLPALACAETVVLKSGKTLSGAILEKAPDYIKLSCDGKEVYYENKYIKSITPDNAVADHGDAQPAQDPISFQRGMELASQGKFEAAKAIFQRELSDINGAMDILTAVEKGSMTKEYASNLFQGSMYMMEGEYSKAIGPLEKAWEADAFDIDVNYNLASCYFSLKDYEKTIVYLTVVIKHRPEDLQAYELMSNAYFAMGQYDKAKEGLLIARQLCQKNDDQASVEYFNSLINKIPPSES